MIISGLKNDFVRVNRDDSIDPLLGLSEAISAIFRSPHGQFLPIMSASNQCVCELPAYACVCASMHDNDKLRHI